MRRLMILTTACAIFAYCVGAASAAEGEHRNNGGAKGVSGKDEGHGESHGGPQVQRVPPKEIPHEGGVSIFGGKEHRPDEWRYRYEHGGWWYWSPENHWLFYENGSWAQYSGGDASVNVNVQATAPVASDPNYSWYNNQWWYWKADHWMLWDHERWHDADPGKGPPRREPEHKSEPHKGEHEGSKK